MQGMPYGGATSAANPKFSSSSPRDPSASCSFAKPLASFSLPRELLSGLGPTTSCESSPNACSWLNRANTVSTTCISTCSAVFCKSSLNRCCLPMS
eukprot:592024-Hanusia_phi.AAC.3